MEISIPSNPVPPTKVVPASFVENGVDSEIRLGCNWVLWAHLPHDTDWSVKSYIEVAKITTVNELVSAIESTPDSMIEKCMLFLMREGIDPMWEHPRNRKGGSFSHKLSGKKIAAAWREFAYRLAGETLSTNDNVSVLINGITISPKRNFSILKIWFANCNNQNPKVISPMLNVGYEGCLFRQHDPKY